MQSYGTLTKLRPLEDHEEPETHCGICCNNDTIAVWQAEFRKPATLREPSQDTTLFGCLACIQVSSCRWAQLLANYTHR